MKSRIAISQFKVHCLEIVKGLQSSGRTMIITNRDKPVAEITPIHHAVRESLFGSFQNRAEIKSDLLQPIGEEWDAEQE